MAKFDRMSGTQEGEVVEEGAEQEVYTPRVQYTSDVKLDMSKIRIESLRLAQGLTPEVTERKAMIGQYLLTNYAPTDEVILVPLAAQNIRVLKKDPKGPPVCSAPTGEYGFGDPGGECATCPMSKWGEYNPATKKSAPPPCKDGVSVRAYSITHQTVVDVQFLGGASAPGAFIMQQGMGRGFNNFTVRLGSKQVSNQRGAWVTPTVEMMPGDVPEEHQDMASRWYQAIVESQRPTSEVLKELGARVKD